MRLSFVVWHSKNRYRNMRDRACLSLSRLLPRRLAYWCYIRVIAHATTGKFGNTHPDEATFGVASRRWHEPNGCART